MRQERKWLVVRGLIQNITVFLTHGSVASGKKERYSLRQPTRCLKRAGLEKEMVHKWSSNEAGESRVGTVTPHSENEVRKMQYLSTQIWMLKLWKGLSPVEELWPSAVSVAMRFLSGSMLLHRGTLDREGTIQDKAARCLVWCWQRAQVPT